MHCPLSAGFENTSSDNPGDWRGVHLPAIVDDGCRSPTTGGPRCCRKGDRFRQLHKPARELDGDRCDERDRRVSAEVRRGRAVSGDVNERSDRGVGIDLRGWARRHLDAAEALRETVLGAGELVQGVPAVEVADPADVGV
jgi:hypothetical protein